MDKLNPWDSVENIKCHSLPTCLAGRNFWLRILASSGDMISDVELVKTSVGSSNSSGISMDLCGGNFILGEVPVRPGIMDCDLFSFGLPKSRIWKKIGTVWIFQDFSVTQIFREINFGDSTSAKYPILTDLEVFNFDFDEF